MARNSKLPTLGLLYLDYVLQFFDTSNFKGWPDKIEKVTYHWGNDKARLIAEIKRKKIDVLIGNVPATAYETFRDISLALPHVRFVPSLDTQFSNKSKENVTRFAWKYKIPVPKTRIFYNPEEGEAFLKKAHYPKIIKKSYGPSNYGGYFVHKVDSFNEATALFKAKKYYPMYIQDFIPMEADIRVMLIGHKPVCAFWRRPPEGKWLTNTSQGGSMDYHDVPKKVLDLAVRVSKAAKAEYWACDVAYGKDGKVRILECATAFAAFPYIRDWIGQYLMWKFSDGRFPKPHIPVYNWEELSKINKSLLRTMRHITFGAYSPSYDGGYFGKKKKVLVDGEYYLHALDEHYAMENTLETGTQEWPSQTWNYQGKFALKPVRSTEVVMTPITPSDEAQESPAQFKKILGKKALKKLLTSIEGVGEKKFDRILEMYGSPEAVAEALNQGGTSLEHIKGLTTKIQKKILTLWEEWHQKG
ncbi:hypothetical protein JWV37_07315 [Sulfurospirillum sp. T05]|uniref:ATP-grasp domain-containing protein n=1 Tax=Sulfurospirillum tamanense TaxID=2813362 RepID=A0ABS2WTS2_9BACT|nr:hypothetical protein [Sulfurospirillum tamanensis]MBN2964584.1 hypothetical protein [Sulfurospirillum tamanensis]